MMAVGLMRFLEGKSIANANRSMRGFARERATICLKQKGLPNK